MSRRNTSFLARLEEREGGQRPRGALRRGLPRPCPSATRSLALSTRASSAASNASARTSAPSSRARRPPRPRGRGARGARARWRRPRNTGPTQWPSASRRTLPDDERGDGERRADSTRARRTAHRDDRRLGRSAHESNAIELSVAAADARAQRPRALAEALGFLRRSRAASWRSATSSSGGGRAARSQRGAFGAGVRVARTSWNERGLRRRCRDRRRRGAARRASASSGYDRAASLCSARRPRARSWNARGGVASVALAIDARVDAPRGRRSEHERETPAYTSRGERGPRREPDERDGHEGGDEARAWPDGARAALERRVREVHRGVLGRLRSARRQRISRGGAVRAAGALAVRTGATARRRPRSPRR